MYLYIHVTFIMARLFPSSFLDTYSLCDLWDISPCALSSIFLSSCPFVLVPSMFILKMVLSILQEELPYVYLFDEIPVAELSLKKLSRPSKVYFLLFFIYFFNIFFFFIFFYIFLFFYIFFIYFFIFSYLFLLYLCLFDGVTKYLQFSFSPSVLIFF